MNLIAKFRNWWLQSDYTNEWMRTDPVSGEIRPRRGWLSTDKERVARFVAEADAATEEVVAWQLRRMGCTCSSLDDCCSSCPSSTTSSPEGK